MALHPDPARKLTSREITKIVAGVYGSFAGWCDVEDLMEAIKHFHKHRDSYRDMFKAMGQVLDKTE